MQVHDSLISLIGNTPLVRLRKVTRGARRGPGAGQGRVPQPRRLGEGPDRAADGRGRRGRRASCEPGGTIVEPTSGNTGVGLAIVAGRRATAASSCARTRSARTRSACCGRTAPRWWSARPRSPRSTRTPTTRSPTGWPARSPAAWKPNQYSNPNNPRSHYETTGPEIWEQTDGRITHFVAGHRHRRHDHRRRPVPQGGLRRPGADHRRRPGGLGLLRRHRPAVPGRGRRRGLLAGDLRPDHLRPGHRGLRRGLASR